MSGRSSAPWRSPYLVPLYALVAAFLLAVGIGASGERTARLAVVEPSAPAAQTSATAPLPSPFTAASGGRPTFSVTVPDPAVRQDVSWTVMARVEGQSSTFAPVRAPASLSPAAEQSLDDSLVDRLLCVTAPAGWTVTAPPGVADLVDAATGVDPGRTACQGGWSDPRAVPATLTFTVVKSR